MPGTDHAGIATQNVVEKQLAKESISRYDLGREQFVERVWQWKEEYAANIRHQFRAMGCAFDWSRERFTMDPAYADSVLEFFIRLFDEDQIYRGWRVINWCTVVARLSPTSRWRTSRARTRCTISVTR
jgi:valyl-tRNA synthetase